MIFRNFGLKLLSIAIGFFLWVVAQGSADIERGFDIPVVIHGLSTDLVVTEKSADVVNVRMLGTRAALRKVRDDLEYPVEVGGAKPGVADFEVDLTRFELPRGARVVSRSPSRIELTFERRATRAVRVRPDVEGAPAEGFRVALVDVEPPRVKITGARSQVLRLSEVVTETIDVTGATDPVEREVRVSPGGGHVWAEDRGQVKVRVGIEIDPEVQAQREAEAQAKAEAEAQAEAEAEAQPQTRKPGEQGEKTSDG